jgi:hypothetical protein
VLGRLKRCQRCQHDIGDDGAFNDGGCCDAIERLSVRLYSIPAVRAHAGYIRTRNLGKPQLSTSSRDGSVARIPMAAALRTEGT